MDDELDPALAALLAPERDAPAVDAARLAAVRENLEAALAPTAVVDPSPRAPAPPPPAPGASSGLLRLGGMFALGLVVGAAGYATLGPKPMPLAPPIEPAPVVLSVRSPEPEPAPPVAQVAPPATASPAPSSAPARAVVSAQASPAPPAASTGVALAPTAPTAPTEDPTARPGPEPSVRPQTLLDEERGLLERGRVALARRDWVSSLEAVRAHRQRFPKGQLAEERDALEVQGLAAGGHTADARRRGEAFLVAYPQSMLRGRIDALLRELPR
jgi:hypothetical protein